MQVLQHAPMVSLHLKTGVEHAERGMVEPIVEGGEVEKLKGGRSRELSHHN
ncbi:hypothetical protein D9M68_973490 [compost metagenome]